MFKKNKKGIAISAINLLVFGGLTVILLLVFWIGTSMVKTPEEVTNNIMQISDSNLFFNTLLRYKIDYDGGDLSVQEGMLFYLDNPNSNLKNILETNITKIIDLIYGDTCWMIKFNNGVVSKQIDNTNMVSRWSFCNFMKGELVDLKIHTPSKKGLVEYNLIIRS